MSDPQPEPAPARVECPGSRGYVRGVSAMTGVVITRMQHNGFPLRALCPFCGHDYQVVGPGTYLHVRKHYAAAGDA